MLKEMEGKYTGGQLEFIPPLTFYYNLAKLGAVLPREW
jgi:hypothetical protein